MNHPIRKPADSAAMSPGSKPLTAEQAIAPARTLQSADRAALVVASFLFVLALLAAAIIAAIGAAIAFRSLMAGKLLPPVVALSAAVATHATLAFLLHALLGQKGERRGLVRQVTIALTVTVALVLVAVALARLGPLSARFAPPIAIVASLGLFLLELGTALAAGLLSHFATANLSAARDEARSSGALARNLDAGGPAQWSTIWRHGLRSIEHELARVGDEIETTGASLVGSERAARLDLWEGWQARLRARLSRWDAACPYEFADSEAPAPTTPAPNPPTPAPASLYPSTLYIPDADTPSSRDGVLPGVPTS